MEKKLLRAFEPSMTLCFVVMLLFALGSFLSDMLVLSAIEASVTVVLFLIYVFVARRKRRELKNYILSTTNSRDTALKNGVPFPMAIIRLDTDEIIWSNLDFQQITGMSDSLLARKMQDAIPDFSSLWLIDGKNEAPAPVSIGDRRYRMTGNVFRPNSVASGKLMASIYLLDQTELYFVRDEYVRSRPVAAVILVDNYDELTNNLPDERISFLNAQIDSRITRWVGSFPCLNRKVEKNRYLLLFEVQYLKALEEAKFSLIESIHTVVNPNGIAATLSIGVGKEGEGVDECYSFAVLALEMALSRGGDQAVIKDRYNFSFYGGRGKEAERHSKVKSRVVAGTLSELIRQSSKVFIMGHRNSDNDAIGAAAGLMCLCRKLNKQAQIVTDMTHSAALPLIERLQKLNAYEDAFITPDDALLSADPQSLLIIVDTNRPEQVESRPLLEAMTRVVLIDHHRKAADSIEEVLLSLHEPAVSSASELVTELLQYAADPQDLLPEEARALLSGIVLDTKNFCIRTSSGAFEAAAFLRRLGADPTEVKRLFRSNLEDVISRFRIIQNAKIYAHNVAVAMLERSTDRAVAAQAADELLNVNGIEASFVLYPDGDRVIVSARSLGEVNVQMILEPLSGGGNAATAGAQISGQRVQEVREALLKSIDAYFQDAE
ncbi:MAG: DHH family phosphoesterase [Oscillospiraceae bacterium]|nr:DHH family phosphoesterase [Oscillospiraceae bacterium]